MGWDFQHIEPGEKPIDLIRRDLNGEYRIVDFSVRGNVAYLAVSHKDDADMVEAVVVLIQRDRNSYYNFGMKWVDENMGPNEDNCPARILDKLTPTTSEWAVGWRQRCRDRIAASAVARTRGKAVKPGTRIRFDTSIEFGDGVTRDTFTYVEGSTFVAADYVRCRVSRWKERAFTVLETKVTEQAA